MKSSLENRVSRLYRNKKAENQSDSSKSLEERISEEEKKKVKDYLEQPSSLTRKIFDVASYGLFNYGLFSLVGPAMWLGSLIPLVGLPIGAAIEAKTRGERFTWRKFRREASTGQVFGLSDYLIFSTPDMLIKKFPKIFGVPSLPSRIGRTLLFNPLFAGPYVAGYNVYTYIRDYVGYGKFLLSIPTLGFLKHIRDGWRKVAKPHYWSDLKNTFLFMGPLHFIQFNYHPNVYTRMLQGVLLNNPVFRIIVGLKNKAKSSGRKSYNYQAHAPKKYKATHKESKPGYDLNPTYLPWLKGKFSNAYKGIKKRTSGKKNYSGYYNPGFAY